jgi:hypothetical protein
MATQDNGLAALLYCEGRVKAKVGDGTQVTISTSTRYPFEDKVEMKIQTAKAVSFPIYLLVPEWAVGATIKVGQSTVRATPGKYVRLESVWQPGERIAIHLPMTTRVRTWSAMKDSVSVDYGPLTFSLKIAESFHQVDGKSNTQGDSAWQPSADASKWPTYEILPESAWNYGLVQSPSFKVVKRGWPKNNYPFTLDGTPIEIVTEGKRIPDWKLDENGLAAVLPQSPVAVDSSVEQVTLVPMGAARLRISAFPTVK